MTVRVASHALNPVNKSAFSELRSEVADDQYPTVRRRLELLALEMVPDMFAGEDAAVCTLEGLIDYHTEPLEQLALKHEREPRPPRRRAGWHSTPARPPTTCAAPRTPRSAG